MIWWKWVVLALIITVPSGLVLYYKWSSAPVTAVLSFGKTTYTRARSGGGTAAAWILGIVAVVLIGFGIYKWSKRPKDHAAPQVARREVLSVDTLARDSIFTLTNQFSKEIRTGLDFCAYFSTLGTYAYEIMDQEGNTMIYPANMKEGDLLNFKNANGDIIESVRVVKSEEVRQGVDATFPRRTNIFKLRAVDTTNVRFEMTRKEPRKKMGI